jgi:nitrate reductase NapE component
MKERQVEKFAFFVLQFAFFLLPVLSAVIIGAFILLWAPWLLAP